MTTTNPAPTADTKPAAKKKEPEAAPKPPIKDRYDWSWRHGPIIGPLNAGAGVAAAGMVGDLAGVSPWWGAAVGVTAAAGMTARAATRDISRGGLFYRAGCWVGAGGWLSWALATSAWSPDVLTALVGGVIGAGLAAPEMADHEERVNGRRKKEAEAAATKEAELKSAEARIKIAVEWEGRLDRVCYLKGALVQAVQVWPDEVGYTLQVRMPRGGATWQQVSKNAAGLASDADLPHGCGVEVGPGASRGVMLVRVSIVDTTAVAKDYPDDYSPLTLTQPLPIGMHRAGITATVELLEDPMVMCGRRGSGKTVALQVINTDLARCPDVLIWHIDLNGAGMSKPWIRPWLDGKVRRPIVDWVAPDQEEALLMVETAIRIAKGRKGAYEKLMLSVNDDKIPISAQVPAIMIVLDEGAEAVAVNRGNRHLATALETLISVGRAARVNELLSGVRATGDIIPTSIQSQAGVKIWMRPEEQQEVAQLLGWHTGISIDDAPYPGSGLMRTPSGGGIKPYRGYKLQPQQIMHAAIECEPLRPDLDAPSARIAGADYTNRWARYQAWSTAQEGTTVTVPPMPEKPDRPKGEGIAGLGGAAANLDEEMAKLRKVREAAEAKNQDNQVLRPRNINDEFAAIVAGETWGDAPETPDASDGREVAREVLAAAGPEGLHRDELARRLAVRGVEPSRATLYRWLKSIEAQQLEGRDGWFRVVDQ